jgi:steroid delta-isomerase-like uncharacterized protein
MSYSKTIQDMTGLFNNHNIKDLSANYADDAVVHDPLYPEPLRGKAAIENDWVEFLRSFPDIKSEVRTIVESDNTVATEYNMRGTNTGPIVTPEGELPASGKIIEMSVGIFSRFGESGKIVEERRYYNVAALMEQLGFTQ